MDQAEELYRDILRQTPEHADALHYHGLLQHQRGAHEAAFEQISRSVGVNPANAKALNNAGLVLIALERHHEALVYLDRSLAIDAEQGKAYFNRGRALVELADWQLAEASLRKAAELEPHLAEAHFLLGRSLRQQSRLPEAADHYRKAITLKPDFPEAIANLGILLGMQGDTDGAIAAFRQVLSLKPDDNDVRSKLLLAMNYASDINQQEIEQESATWDTVAMRGTPIMDTVTNDRDPDRVLRVGFVSPDFRTHSVSYFFRPLLRGLRDQPVATYCYAQVSQPDDTTRDLQSLADHWHSTVGMDDDAVTRLIRDDAIDILIDLAGHTRDNRLDVFARRPAPVQATWLGYPNTTGLKAIDYRLVDAVSDPDDSGSETLIRLPNGFLCYEAPDDAPEPVLQHGDRGVVFGSFNNAQKISDDCIELWARVLSATPEARLLLKSTYLSEGDSRVRLLTRFAEHGIDANRLDMRGKTISRVDHLQLYNVIDVCLDTVPYNGTTTTCEALWMGVPVMTLLGDHHRARVSASILKHAGLDDLIASDRDDFVARAVALAQDRPRLQDYRKTMRHRMAPMCDGARFARDFADALRDIWREWCRDAVA